LHIAKLHFSSPATDLTIGFRAEHRWFGGGDPLPNGTWFLPNIPTEEVSPYPTSLVPKDMSTHPAGLGDGFAGRDVTFTFKNGLVTSCTARVGQGVMDNFLKIDQGAPGWEK
jgi:aminopeptidase